MAAAIETLPRNTPPSGQTVGPAPPQSPRQNSSETLPPVEDRVTLSAAATNREPPIPADPLQGSPPPATQEPAAGTNNPAAATPPAHTTPPQPEAQAEQPLPRPPEPVNDQATNPAPPAETPASAARPAPPAPVAPPEPAVSPEAAASPETRTPPEAPPVPAEEALFQGRREELRQQAFAAMTPVSAASHIPQPLQPLDVTI